MCKLNRVASQPHVLALSPSVIDKENHNHYPERTMPIQIKNRTSQSPLPSPSEHSFGGTLPRSFERPKGVILTMDAIKNKNAQLGDPDFNIKTNTNNDDQPTSEDVSSSKY